MGKMEKKMETIGDYTRVILGVLNRDNGKENGTYHIIKKGLYRGYLGIMDKKMETTI